MNTLKKQRAILSLHAQWDAGLCVPLTTLPEGTNYREQSDICQGVVKDANGESIIGASVLVKAGRQTAALRDLTVIFPRK